MNRLIQEISAEVFAVVNVKASIVNNGHVLYEGDFETALRISREG